MVCAYTLRLLGKLKLYVQVPGQPVATYEAGKAIDEEVLDGVLALGMACMQMQTGESLPYQQGEEGLCYAVWGGPC